MLFLILDSDSLYCAYIDPNAGGWLFQLFFPLVVAISGLWMVFRRRMKNLWNRFFGNTKEEQPKTKDDSQSP